MKSEKVVSGFLWRFLERFGAYLVSFVVSIVLARMLGPDVYGTIALVAVFTNILQVFVDTGLGRALIQKKDADALDYSSVFCFNLLMCVLLYLLVFFLSPVIAVFYRKPELTGVMRVQSLMLIVAGLKNVQQAYITKEMLFKKFFYATLTGTLLSAVVGIVMAYFHCGVWALVGQSLTNMCVDTLMLWVTVHWKPGFSFSFHRLKGLLSYGWKLLLAALVGTLSDNLRQLLIGKFYSSEDLAFYNKGEQIPGIVNGNVNAALESAIFPALAEAQDQVSSVRRMTRKVIITSTYLMAPLLIGLAACAEQLVELLLTEKWLPCVPFMRIFCITYLFYPIHTANLNVILAIGRSDIDLKLEVTKKTIEILILILVAKQGVMAIGYSLLVICGINMIINASPNKKLIGYGLVEQIKDIFPELCLSLLMGLSFSLGKLPIPGILRLLLQVVTGAGIYLLGSMLMKLEAFCYLKEIVLKKRGKK